MNMPPQQMTFLPPPMGMMPPNVGGGQMGLPFMPGMMPPFGAPMMPPNQGMMTGMMPGYQPNVPGQWINQPRPTG